MGKNQAFEWKLKEGKIEDVNYLRSHLNQLLLQYPEYKEKKFNFKFHNELDLFNTFLMSRRFLKHIVDKFKTYKKEEDLD